MFYSTMAKLCLKKGRLSINENFLAVEYKSVERWQFHAFLNAFILEVHTMKKEQS